jgi:hypothetical protein
MLRQLLTAFTLSTLVTLPVVAKELATATCPQGAINVTTVEHPRLGDVKTIYVEPLGSDTGSQLIRSKLINRLIKYGTLSGSESPDNVDAVLKGAADIDKRHYLTVTPSFVSGGTSYRAQGAFRLVSKDGHVLWLDEMTSRKLLSLNLSVSSRLADKLVSRLKSAIETDRNQVAALSNTNAQ